MGDQELLHDGRRPNSSRRRARVVFFSGLLLTNAGFTLSYDLSTLNIRHTINLQAGLGRGERSFWLDEVGAIGTGAGQETDKVPEKTAQAKASAGPHPHLGEHYWDTNGLLVVNGDGPHPIHELIRRSGQKWEEKQNRASRTLEEAVKEYERRNGRAPPPGFGEWWQYVQQNDVRLPDEYDQLHSSLEPYWGVDPSELIALQAEREKVQYAWTIGKEKRGSPLTVLSTALPEQRVEQYLEWGAHPHIELMSEVAKHLPPFRATFNPHDMPNQYLNAAWKSAALDAVKQGKYLQNADLPSESGWTSMCPPGSPLHEKSPPIGSWPTSQSKKTFIHDHRTTMDVCQHPQLLLLHGTFLGRSDEPETERFPAPQFSFCSTSVHADINALSIQKDEFVTGDLPWAGKDDDRLAWRGTPTGMWHEERDNVTWRNSHRVRFVSVAAESTAEVGSSFGQTEYVSYLRSDMGPDLPVGDAVGARLSSMHAAMMDVGFAGGNYNCGGEVCDVMDRELAWRDYVTQQEMGRHKYLFDIDGNGWSSRFRRLMSTHSAVFKATLYPEWFVDRIQPWAHYVPVQLDYSDLYDSLTFFAGDYRDGAGAHDDLAREIGRAGRDWVAKYWRREDMVAYMFRLYLEYARLMSVDRDHLNFTLS